ncbi:AfsR/SARP family transcriptional regulator [Allorhizocola rhizosphaerae]|uniref:AfsR/SARP family transcriptional regulator n=1 Tax=Allorhizocola rhizosphaerae TaxID=1872709 RepID=UPI0013C3083A|nr:BTAD domain-containing putative transcriptional regulator [Allorhizocola rhizosphaerae]
MATGVKMEFRMLGPVELHVDGRVVEPGPMQQRAVLAALAVDAGRVVPTDVLVDRVWGSSATYGARRTMQTYLSRLRRLLRVSPDSSALVRQSGGYVLRIDGGDVDVHRFRRLVRCAAAEPAPRRAGQLEAALSLWRGEALAGLRGEWAERVRRAWHRERVDAAMRWAQTHLELGTPQDALSLLEDLVAENPLLEPLSAALIEALHASGRPDDALWRYRAIRDRLADELGLEPGTQLATVQRSVLQRAAPAAEAPAVAPRPVTVPAQLPLAPQRFTCRGDELRTLDEMAFPVARAGSAALVAICGSAGVGKTALALHWGHRVRNRYPDGNLYINLRGFHPSGDVVPPAMALRVFLIGLGVPVAQIPSEFEARAGLYRSLLAARRMLVVLDNARDSDQVRPLLPGSAGSLVLITSRDGLAGLAAAEGASVLPLRPFGPADARALLRDRLGDERVSAGGTATDEIAQACGGLPLALTIAAARVAGSSGMSLRSLADELRLSPTPLDALRGWDAATDIRAIFACSYQTLSHPAARLFRMLSLYPGGDCSLAGAASISGLPLPRLRACVDELIRAHLLFETSPGRLACHDLLRAYAFELVQEVETQAERDLAVTRQLDHHLHTASAAVDLVSPQRYRIEPRPPAAGVTVDRFASRADAVAWFEAERAALLASVESCAKGGRHWYAWQIGCAIAGLLTQLGHWQEHVDVLTLAHESAGHLDDPVALAHTHRTLGVSHALLRRDEAAHQHYRQALRRFASLGDLRGQALTHRNIAWLVEQQSLDRKSLRHNRIALALYQRARDKRGQARALNGIGWDYARLGEYQAALRHSLRAATLLAETGDSQGEAVSWDSVGYAHHHLGAHEQAIHCYHKALGLLGTTGDRYNEAEVRLHLSDSLEALGDSGGALSNRQAALRILEQLNHPQADQVRASLAR